MSKRLENYTSKIFEGKVPYPIYSKNVSLLLGYTVFLVFNPGAEENCDSCNFRAFSDTYIFMVAYLYIDTRGYSILLVPIQNDVPVHITFLVFKDMYTRTCIHIYGCISIY